MKILSDEAEQSIRDYLNKESVLATNEDKKAMIINELSASVLSDNMLKKLFESYRKKGRDLLVTVFPRSDIEEHKEYISPHYLERKYPTSDFSLSFGIPPQHTQDGYNIVGKEFGFYLNSYKHENIGSTHEYLPPRVKDHFSWEYNRIFLEQGEIVPILRVIVYDQKYNLFLPKPEIIKIGLEKAIGQSINCVSNRHMSYA